LDFSNILIRATNWVGDAVMSLASLRAVRVRFPSARITILAKATVADLYTIERVSDEIIIYDSKSRWGLIRELRALRFDCAILLQNAFEAALIAWMAGIPNRIGYDHDGRGFLLTHAVAVPKRGEIPRHQRFYYLELLHRAGLIEVAANRAATGRERHHNGPGDNKDLVAQASARERTKIIGVSPGAAYGGAKRWLPERFAEAAAKLARVRGASIALFGSPGERALCEQVEKLLAGHNVTNHAGQTTLAQFIELAAQCEVFLTNDSGAMHIASALGVPTVAIFGATDDAATGPTGPKARVVRETVECSPCLLRECPIDHRCMTRVSADRVVKEALALLLD